MPPRRRKSTRPEASARPVPEFVLCGRIWQAGKLQSAEIGLDSDGRIVRVAKDVRAPRRHSVDQGIILPAATDLHTHFREPGGDPTVETLASGTLQAAFGGVGAVGEMPNTRPATISRDDVEAKASRSRGRIAIDLLIYAGLTARTRVESVARAAGAFKLYLTPTTGVEHPPDLALLPSLLERVAAVGLPLTVHAEDPRSLRPDVTVTNGLSWNAARPPEAETHALELLSSAPVKLRLHLAHITLSGSVVEARRRGWSCETTPQHLLLSANSKADARLKVNPPLRPEEARVALWEQFKQGQVSCLASDHAPHSSEAKAHPWPEAPSGVPGVETMLPLMLAKVRSGELALATLIGAACDRPARWFGLPTGRIAPGHRGHLIVVDFQDLRKVETRRLHANCGWTPFEGFPAIFPREHYHAGELIVDRGEFVGRLSGNVVRPEFAP